MDAVFKKLNFKGESTVYAINAPDCLQESLDSIVNEANVKLNLKGAQEIAFALVFVTQQKEIDLIIPTSGPLLKGDAVLWMCYPKGTSKKYKCDFNRDTGWSVLGNYSLEPVRMVAIDEDWSALRFRKVEYIKVLSRKLGILSEAGKGKAKLQ
ncbi:hypothetical protein BH09BAC1_BH09BAC1_28060 [soil metagenome]